MATAEAKTEVKEVEETSEALKYKTWVLRVSLHCEGCKRKVKKILQNINGVFTIDFDMKLHKVTVTTSTDADTLIKKLMKAGKHAELWPQNPNSKPKNQPNSINLKPKPNPQDITSDESTAVHGGDNPKPTAQTEQPPEAHNPSKNEEKDSTSKNTEAITNPGEENNPADSHGGGEKLDSSPPEVQGGDIKNNAGENGRSGPSCSAGGGDGEVKKKKKKKKGNRCEGGEGEGLQSTPAPACTESSPPIHDDHPPSPTPSQIAANHSPPRNPMYQFPVHAYVSQPVYVASYNTSHANTSYGPSYYAAPPPYSYAYVHSDVSRDTSPPSPEQSNSSASDPFDLFSDENPSGCVVM